MAADLGSAEGEGAAAAELMMRFTARVLAAGTDTPITSILAGRDFDLQIRVQDLRPFPDNLGVFAAYTDVLYDKSLARIRVPEIQTVGIGGSFEGSFTLSLDPFGTTAAIPYTLESETSRRELAGAIQTALNDLLGAGTVLVAQVPDRAEYAVRFVGRPDVDLPLLVTNDQTIYVVETVKGDPTLAESFTEAFRSRDLGLNNNLPGPYQNDLYAGDLPDRVDDVGAFGFGSPFPREVVRARVKARLPVSQGSGNLLFSPNVSQLSTPVHDNLVFADITTDPPEKSYVPPASIDVVAGSLVINAAVVAAATTVSIDEDDTAGIIIPVLSLATKNPAAPAGAIELRGFSPLVGGSVTQLDPNNTPGDFTDDLVRFVPAPNFHGPATFTYSAGIVGDNIPEDVGVGMITVNVNPVNDGPVISVPGAQNKQEDETVVFSAAGGNAISMVDVDADPSGVQVTLAATNGTITLGGTANLTFVSGDGAADEQMVFKGTTAAVNAALNGLSFVPTRDFSGIASLSIGTSDLGNSGKISGVALENHDAVTINIAARNDAPTIAAPVQQSVYSVNDLAFSPAFNNAIVISDVDAGQDSLTVTLSTTNNVGRLSATAVGDAQVTGSGTFQLGIIGSLASINATLGNLLLTPQSPGGTLTILVSDQGHNPPTEILSAQTTINITVLSAVGPFAANDSPAGLLEGSPSYVIDVLANDLTIEGMSAPLVSFTQPTIGTVARFDPNNTPADLTDDKLLYTPPPKNQLPDLDFFRPLSVPPITFSYKIDELPDSQQGTVSIRIANEPDVPVAVADGIGNSYATTMGVPLNRDAAQGVLANDTVVDNAYGDASFAILSVLGAGAPTPVATTGGGTVMLNADGSFTYTPAPEFLGNDTFTYRAHSSLGPDSAPATVTIHVSAPPSASHDSFTTAVEDQAFVSPTSVLANDQDLADGEPLSAVLVTNVPAFAGSVTLSSNGVLTYTPALHFNTTRPPGAPITFTYKVVTSSGRESSPGELATVSIVVNETNDDPRASADTFRAVLRKGQIGIDQVVPVLGNDSSDPDGAETLTVVGVNGTLADAGGNTPPVPTTSGGSVRLEGFQIKYTSPPVTTSDSFSYTIGDGRGGTATAQVQVFVATAYDYGDAAESYGTRFANDGVRHKAIGPRLGELRDDEEDAVASALANGDDLAEVDDEDGLIASTLVRGKTSSLTVAVIADAPGAKLDGWIDFNRDGSFSEDEKIADGLAAVSGNQQVAFLVPATALLGPTVARLRISTTGGLSPIGLAADGEAEDHAVMVLQEVTVDLPSGSGLNRVGVRRNGEDLEVVNLSTAAVIGGGPLAVVHTVIIRGSATDADEIAVDYATGGFFSLPGGIQLDGGASSGDELIVAGDPGDDVTVRYVIQEQGSGVTTLETESGSQQNEIRFANFEPVTFSGIGGIVVEGVLNVGAQTLTFPETVQVELSGGAVLAGGTINAPGGLKLNVGDQISGFGTINTANDPAKPLINNGGILGNSATEPITLSGFVTGVGALDHVVVTGTLSPGASAAAVAYGNMAFDADSVLIVEIGGLLPGVDHDQLSFTGSAALDGKLEVVLINGFAPAIDDGFSIIAAGAGVSGEFSSVVFPAVPTDRKWKLLPSANEVRLDVVTTRPWHNRFRPLDVDASDSVEAGDALFIINYINSFEAGPVPEDAPNVKPFYDVDGDNFVVAGDALKVINAINSDVENEAQGEADEAAASFAMTNPLDDLIGLLAEDAAGASPRKRRLS